MTTVFGDFVFWDVSSVRLESMGENEGYCDSMRHCAYDNLLEVQKISRPENSQKQKIIEWTSTTYIE